MTVRTLAASLALAALAGCSVPHLELGPLQQHSFVVGPSNVDEAELALSIGVGSLTVEPGSEDVLEADGCTNVVDFRPRLYEERRDRCLYASLTSGQQGVGFNVWDYDELEHTWNVRLGGALPMSLDVDVGAGEARLELGGLPLRGLSMDVGAAEVKAAFSAPNPEVLHNLVLDMGAAEVELTGLGNANFEELRMDCGAGEFTLDFGGDWRRSAVVWIDGGMGELRLRVPDDIGVCVTTEETYFADVGSSLSGLRQDGDRFVNDHYGECEIQLDIHVEFSFGEVSIVRSEVEGEAEG